MLLKDVQEFVDILFNKKLIRHSMKRFQSKLHKTGTYNVCKILCLVLMIKNTYVMMVLIVWLIFIKM